MLTKKRNLMGPLSPKYYHNEPVISLATYWDASHIHIPFVGHTASYPTVAMPRALLCLSQSFPHTITNSYSEHPTANKPGDEERKGPGLQRGHANKRMMDRIIMEIKLALKETS